MNKRNGRPLTLDRPETKLGHSASMNLALACVATALFTLSIALPLSAHADLTIVEPREVAVDNAGSVVFDTTPPELTLLGECPLYVPSGSNFSCPGAEAVDNFNGDISDLIETGGYIDTSTAGDYTLTYTVADFAGNKAAPVQRTVVVDDGGEKPAAGSVKVQVNVEEAGWVVMCAEGGKHEGAGNAIIEGLPTGSVAIDFHPLDGYETPPSDSAILHDGETVTFEGEYIEASHHVIWARRDHNGSPGRRVTVPVLLNGGQGRKHLEKQLCAEEVTQFAVNITFDANLLTLKDVKAGAFVEKWNPIHVNAKSNSVRITGNGNRGSRDGGVLAVLHFEVNPEISKSDSAALRFNDPSLNNGALPVSTRDGRIKINTGQFRWGDVDGDDEVTVTDANYLLRYKAGLIDELPAVADSSEPGYLGANVSGMEPPVAGALDAALVWQYTQGIIDRFPADFDGDGFGPETEEPNRDFAENLLGYLDQATTRTLYITDEVTVSAGMEIEMPVRLNNAARVLGYYLDLAYDAETLSLVDVVKGPETSDNWLQPIVNDRETGRVRVAGASVRSHAGPGSLAILKFRAHDEVTEGQTAWFEVLDADLNDGAIPVEITGAPLAPAPASITPDRGAATGGVVVRIQGANLRAVDGVYFGDAPAEWFEVDTLRSQVRALVPAGTGDVDVRLTAFETEGTLEKGFSYFTPDVQLTIAPPAEVDLANTLTTPVEITAIRGAPVGRIQFNLNYDPRIFAAIETEAIPVLAEPQQDADVETELLRPGMLQVTVNSTASGGLSASAITHCNLLAVGYDAEYPSLIYLSDVTAHSTTGARLSAGTGAR